MEENPATKDRESGFDDFCVGEVRTEGSVERQPVSTPPVSMQCNIITPPMM